jgi:hypothetical protein
LILFASCGEFNASFVIFLTLAFHDLRGLRGKVAKTNHLLIIICIKNTINYSSKRQKKKNKRFDDAIDSVREHFIYFDPLQNHTKGI